MPMFIVHKKGLKLDGQNPTYLYAYGGFNISMTPSFSIANMLWLENGGVYAMPNLRGGGEYGEDWHKAGMTPNKQKRVRRFYCRSRVPHRPEVYFFRETSRSWWF